MQLKIELQNTFFFHSVKTAEPEGVTKPLVIKQVETIETIVEETYD